MKLNRNGYTYRILERVGNLALAEGRSKTGARTWEVWDIQRTKADHTYPNGAIIPAGSEVSPSNEQWGAHGWTYLSRGRASEALRDRIRAARRY